jgi:thiol-disulfide isomerase/thioredoxin
MEKLTRFSGILLSLALAGGAMAQKIDFHLVPKGAMPQIGFYYPERLTLDATKPAGWTNTDALSADAMYGTLDFGGRLLPVAVTFDKSQPSALLVDASGRGDFHNATSFPFAVRGSGENAVYMGSADIPSHALGNAKLGIQFYKFASGTARGTSMKTLLLYYADYAMIGTAAIGGQTYKAALLDAACRGSFEIPTGDAPANTAPKIDFLIDRNGDGRFSGPAETFNAQNPFNISGKSYLVTGNPSGSRFSLKASATMVAEIQPAPVTAVGRKVLAFTATDRNGKKVNFPADFKGKVVMLDFWATWCGPCMGEVPNVVKQYNAYHDKGFEILGISLDNAQTINNITKVTSEKGMTWDQVADGKYWDAAVAKLYGIQAIPAAFIVDGDTGKILAEGDAIRGEALAPAIQKALAQRKGSTPK